MAASLKAATSSDDRAFERPIVAHSNTGHDRRPRLITDFDVPWMADLARRRYDSRYDFIAGEMWVRGIVLKSPQVYLPIRTKNAFLIGLCTTVPWRPQEVETNVVMLAADHGAMWEAVTLCRASLEWAKRRKAIIWRITSETDFDLGPIAVRLGAAKEPSRYVVRLE